MPPSLHGRVEDPAGAPLPGIAVVARAPRGEILARGRSDEQGRFHLQVAPAALRGVRWNDEQPPTLRLELDRSHDGATLAEEVTWVLDSGPAETVTLVVVDAEAPSRTVLPFDPPAGAPDARTAALVAGLATALAGDVVSRRAARAWLFEPGVARRLSSRGASPDAVNLIRDGMALLARDDPDPRALRALLDEALDLLHRRAANPGEPWA